MIVDMFESGNVKVELWTTIALECVSIGKLDDAELIINKGLAGEYPYLPSLPSGWVLRRKEGADPFGLGWNFNQPNELPVKWNPSSLFTSSSLISDSPKLEELPKSFSRMLVRTPLRSSGHPAKEGKGRRNAR